MASMQTMEVSVIYGVPGHSTLVVIFLWYLVINKVYLYVHTRRLEIGRVYCFPCGIPSSQSRRR